MNRPVQPSIEETKARMAAILEMQKRLQTSRGAPSASLRKDRLTRAVNLVLAHKDDFLTAFNEDFGARSRDMSLFTDISGITFGDINNKAGEVSKKIDNPLNYIVLEETNVRSSVNYSAKIHNANEELFS